MLKVSDEISIPESEISMTPIRAAGPGGQHVNKVATAIHLQFHFLDSPSLPERVKDRLAAMNDRRISADGVITIKAQASRSQEQNKTDAIRRLGELIGSAAVEPKPRKKTRPAKKAREKRLADKAHRSKVKAGRGKVTD